MYIFILDILKNVKNPKIVEQELLKVSNIHFKICLSWKLSLEAYGLSQVMVLILTYTYCAVLVALTGYILPALKKESIIPTIGLIAYCLYSIQKFQNLKNTVSMLSLVVFLEFFLSKFFFMRKVFQTSNKYKIFR